MSPLIVILFLDVNGTNGSHEEKENGEDDGWTVVQRDRKKR
jgi:hypothetical protein